MVWVTWAESDVNIIIGELKKNPLTVYSGGWHGIYSESLRWETDEILYINEERYSIDTQFVP